MGAEDSKLAAVGPEANGDRGADPAQLADAVAGLAVEGALATEADPGAEEVPDVRRHPRIQADHTMGVNHNYYPMTHRII